MANALYGVPARPLATHAAVQRKDAKAAEQGGNRPCWPNQPRDGGRGAGVMDEEHGPGACGRPAATPNGRRGSGRVACGTGDAGQGASPVGVDDARRRVRRITPGHSHPSARSGQQGIAAGWGLFEIGCTVEQALSLCFDRQLCRRADALICRRCLILHSQISPWPRRRDLFTPGGGPAWRKRQRLPLASDGGGRASAR